MKWIFHLWWLSAFSIGLGNLHAEDARVFMVSDQFAIRQMQVHTPTVRGMLDILLRATLQKKNVREAWHSVLNPDDKIGIMVASDESPLGGTSPALVEAVVESLVDSGFSRTQIIIWGNRLEDLRNAGITQERLGCQVYGVTDDYDSSAIYFYSLPGRLISGDSEFNPKKTNTKIWDETSGEMLSSNSHISKTLISRVTKIINLAHMTDSETCGIAGAMYNITIRNIDNWRRFISKESAGDPGLAELYADPRFHTKVILHIMDALLAQYAGGPTFYPNYTIEANTLYASIDPVALDSIALSQMNEWRTLAKLPPAPGNGNYLATAEMMGLGQHRKESIRLINAR